MFMQIVLWSLQITHPPESSCPCFLGENSRQGAWANDSGIRAFQNNVSITSLFWKAPKDAHWGLVLSTQLLPNPSTQDSLKATGQGGIRTCRPVGTCSQGREMGLSQ